MTGEKRYILNSLDPSTTGTPQGGTLSPLFANIALHGIENLVKDDAEGL